MRPRRTITARVPALLVAGMLGAAVSWARGDGAIEPYAPGAGQYVVDFDLDLIVARATEVQDARATVADPPRVQLAVESVLRGKLRPGTLPARWVPFLNPSVRRGRETPSEAEAWRHYLATPLRGPKVGERLILAGYWNPDDKRWAVSEIVRFAYSPDIVNGMTEEMKGAEAEILARAKGQNTKIEDAATADRKARKSANLGALCEASTDVVLGTVEGADRIRVTERLWTMPPTPMSLSADSLMGVSRSRTVPVERIVFSSRDERMRNVRLRDAQAGALSPVPLVMFLRRGPYDPGPNARRYRLADHDNGLLVADSVTLRAVRKAVASSSLRSRRSTTPDRDCGASLSQFVGLRKDEQAKVRVKITAVRLERRTGRVPTFVLGEEARGEDVEGFTTCTLPGEMTWNDYLLQPYTISPTPEQMKSLLRALQKTVRDQGVRRGEAAVALLSVHGAVGGRDRAFEAVLGADQLEKVAAAMTETVRDDAHLAWQLNYFKHAYATPMAVDPDDKRP